MRQLNGVYAQWFNRRYGRDGHLFQGRYSAMLVQQDEHLLSAVRYIVRNPLRAGICERVDEWPWSSHHATVGARRPGCLAVDELLSCFAATRPAGRARYRSLVEAGEDPPAPAHALFDGSDEFVVMHLHRIDGNAEYARRHVRPPRPTLEELLSRDVGADVIARANREYGYSMRQIATYLGCGLATVSRRIHAHESSAGDHVGGGTWKT